MKSTAALPRARKDGLVIKQLVNETLVYDLERDEAHCLNQTAALVWKRCDGKTTIARMTNWLQDQLDTSVNADVVSWTSEFCRTSTWDSVPLTLKLKFSCISVPTVTFTSDTTLLENPEAEAVI